MAITKEEREMKVMRIRYVNEEGRISQWVLQKAFSILTQWK